jgi:catechol 2,3-dioxygenase-like lactoylglutathione lyase family enzyme
MEIKLVSSVIFVKDMQVSRRFYEEVLGQKVLMDHGPNIGFEGGFALWQRDHANQIVFGKLPVEQPAAEVHNAELYFETEKLDEAFSRLGTAQVRLIHPLVEQPWGQRVLRFYDPDGHILELGEPMHVVIIRFLAQGQTVEEIAQRTSMPLEIIKQIAGI